MHNVPMAQHIEKVIPRLQCAPPAQGEKTGYDIRRMPAKQNKNHPQLRAMKHAAGVPRLER